MRKNVILVCDKCLSRNYNTTKSLAKEAKRLEVKKFCPRCNSHTIHKETK